MSIKKKIIKSLGGLTKEEGFSLYQSGMIDACDLGLSYMEMMYGMPLEEWSSEIYDMTLRLHNKIQDLRDKR